MTHICGGELREYPAEDCKLCGNGNTANAYFDLAVKEAAFARLAYDQLQARMDQEIERIRGGVLAAYQVDAARWRKFERMPTADQHACLSDSVVVFRQCVDDYEEK